MSNQLAAAIIQVIGGGICGGIIAYFSVKRQKERKELEYYFTSMPLLKFDPKSEPVLNVNVDKSIITGRTEDKGTNIAIRNAYGFSIRIQNRGNEIAEKIKAEIILDQQAKILECVTKPSPREGYEIATLVEKSQLNRLTVDIPYINAGATVHIALISTDNEKPNKCGIDIIGKGVQSFPHGGLRTYLPLIIGGILLFAILIIVEDCQRQANWFPESVIKAIGGNLQTKSVTEAVWTMWHKIIFWAVFIFCGIIYLWKLFSRIDLDVHKPWDTD